MKDLEIWKIYNVGFESTGLLVSSHGRVKNIEWGDRKINDNGNGLC